MSNCTGVRTAPASSQKMSKESSPASQSKPIPASETKETVTPVSHTISLTELNASLEVLNAEVDKGLTVVHCTQTSSSSGANRIPGSPDTRDQKLRTLPYHAQTNGQVEQMNQTSICMIGKLEQDKKVRWSEHLPEMLSAYNGTHSVVTGYSPYFLLFGRKARMPVDYLFPTLHDSPHQTKMEVSVTVMQKKLKEAFTVARHLTSQEATKQRCYYDHKAGAVALQPGDVVMVHTNGFVGKQKVKDRWEDGGFIVESQLKDWPVYKVRCLTTDAKQKLRYRILHRNCLLLVTNEDDSVIPGQQAQAKVTPTISNATLEASVDGEGSFEPLPSLVT